MTQAEQTQMKRDMAAANHSFNVDVIQKRNLAALDEIYTEDARILPPGGPLVAGRPTIKEFWSNLIQAANPKSGELTSIEVMPTGDGAVEIGSAKLILEPEGQGSTEMAVKYVVYWRQENSKWKWHVDIWNQNS